MRMGREGYALAMSGAHPIRRQLLEGGWSLRGPLAGEGLGL